MDAVAMNVSEFKVESGTRVRVIEPNATDDDKVWATVMHASSIAGFLVAAAIVVAPIGSIVGPLIFWLAKRNSSPFIDDHGREAVNFQISIAIYYALLTISCVGIPLIMALPFVQIIAPIIMAIRANHGEYVRYPITIRFLK